MLETVTLQRSPPVAARRYPLRRVITRPRPNPDIEEQVSLAAPHRHVYLTGNRSARVARNCQADVPVGRIAL